MVAIRILASALCLATSCTTAFADDPLPRAKPEEVSLSSERLARIGETLKADIDAGRIPGAVIAIARRGKLVALDAYGWCDKAANIPMTTDTIFNIASMTKPMTAVGALMLYEQGKLLIDDPLSKYFPKFADMRVALRDAGDPVEETVPANRQITIQDLMRHTSGIIYGGRGTTLVHKMYPTAAATPRAITMAPPSWTGWRRCRCCISPARCWIRLWARRARPDHRENQQPVARTISAGQSVDAARHDRHRIFDFARQGRALRQAAAGRSGHRQRASRTPELTQPLKFECGGGCAASTATDYLRFAMMLMNGGRSGEARLLGPQTVDYMLSDQLGPNIKNLFGNADPTRADYGSGLGLGGADDARRGQDDGPGRGVLLARRQRHRLVGRPQGGTRGGVSLGGTRPDPLARIASRSMPWCIRRSWTSALNLNVIPGRRKLHPVPHLSRASSAIPGWRLRAPWNDGMSGLASIHISPSVPSERRRMSDVPHRSLKWRRGHHEEIGIYRRGAGYYRYRSPFDWKRPNRRDQRGGGHHDGSYGVGAEFAVMAIAAGTLVTTRRS